jgi:predicted esterase
LPDDDSLPVDDDVSPADDDDASASPNCASLQEGFNENFMVDGTARSFILNLPQNVESSGPWPIIFNWHGYGDTAQNMAGLLLSSVNSSVMPFILVTPDDVNMQPFAGLDWDILLVDNDNIETRLFDEIMICLNERYDIDRNHIHSVGFSAGAIMCDVLGVLRGKMIASLLTFSGVYFSNPVNDNAYTDWKVDLDTDNKFAQVIVHGGPEDLFNAVVVTINFDQAGANDTQYLNGKGHDVIECNHGLNHTVPPDMQAAAIIRFFKDHPLGAASPYSLGLPTEFPDYCSFSPAE